MRTTSLLLLLTACGDAPAPEPPVVAPPGAITASDLRAHVETLASDEYAGRGTGELGLFKAAGYVSSRFVDIGLVPLEGSQRLQSMYTLYRTGWNPEGTRIAVGDDAFAVGEAFSPFGFSDEGTLSADVVFAGYGITAEEHDYDDYADVDVTGKLVLLLRHEPNEADPGSVFDGEAHSSHSAFVNKARNAQAHGAVGMLLVTDPVNHESGDDFRNDRLRLEPPDPDADAEPVEEPFLAAHISSGLAERLVASTGKSVRELQSGIDATGPDSLALADTRVELNIEARLQAEPIEVSNIIGRIEGSDPELRDEWVVIGAHYDHLGSFEGGGDTVYNGADDNASGTAGLLEIAQAFASAETPPARTVVFAAFSGEEKGLLGSKHAVSAGVLPAEKVVFMLNMDMIGRNPEEPVQVIGDGYAGGLRAAAEAAAPGGLDIRFWGDDYKGSSDHDPFYRADRPFVHVFTGLHDDYHQLGDHADLLDYERMKAIVQMSYGLADEVASGRLSPSFIHHVGWLGVRVQQRDGAAVVSDVHPASRGEKAGMVTGDVIVGIGGAPLERPDVVGARFRALEPGAETTLSVRRGDVELDLPVTRAKTGYLGVYPGGVEDEFRKKFGLGEGEGVLLQGVAEGTPAADAGLLDGDVLFRISGQPVGHSSLSATLSRIGAGEEVRVVVIRGDERLTLPLVLGERPERP